MSSIIHLLTWRRLKILFLILIGALLVTFPILAEEQKVTPYIPGDFSLSLALTSDYILRGTSLNDEHPAPQGSLDYLHPSDIYAGVWSSTVDLNNGTRAEIDLYTGYAHSFDKLTADLRFYYYLYPGAPSGTHYNFFETGVTLGYAWDMFSLQASLNASPEGFNQAGDTYYSKLAATVPVPDHPLAFDTHIARLNAQNNINYGFPDYNEWGFGAMYSTKWIDIRAEYIDTDLNRVACASGCSARGVLTLSRKFPFTL